MRIEKQRPLYKIIIKINLMESQVFVLIKKFFIVGTCAL